MDPVDYGETKLAEGLENLLGKYVDTLVTGGTSIKKCNFIVVLGGRDGEWFGPAPYEYLITPVERGLEDVEKVLVSVAKRLDEGMYPPDQVDLAAVTTDTPPLIAPRSWASNSSR